MTTSTTQPEYPPLPQIAIKNVIDLRDKLVIKLNFLVGKLMTGEDFHTFVDELHRHLPADILRSTVQDSVKDLLKINLTRSLLFETCWRLAGNVPKLLNQKPAVPWIRQDEFEWIPAQVCEIQTTKKLNKFVHELTFQSLAGSLVPRKLMQYWSLKKTYYLSTYRNEKNLGFGFNPSKINARGEQKNNNLFMDIRQFYGLRCFLLIDPKRSQVDPFVTTIGHSYSTSSYNRKLISLRDRAQTPCIKNLNDVECHHCPYGADRCQLATHPKTYKLGDCGRCQKNSFFDPAEEEHKDLCINCVFEERKK